MSIGLMEENEARWVIGLLASELKIDNQSAEQISYARALSELVAVTGNPDEVARILTVITNQAHHLGESIEWLEMELLFEAKALRSESRHQAMLDELKNSGDGNDASLDLYNIRLQRFASTK